MYDETEVFHIYLVTDHYNNYVPVYRSYRDGDLRLVGGANNWEGRVEIFWNGDWGAISDSLWSTADANVVCRQLKHSPESGNYYYR